MQETSNRFKNIFSLLSYLCEYKFTYDDQNLGNINLYEIGQNHYVVIYIEPLFYGHLMAKFFMYFDDDIKEDNLKKAIQNSPKKLQYVFRRYEITNIEIFEYQWRKLIDYFKKVN